MQSQLIACVYVACVCGVCVCVRGRVVCARACVVCVLSLERSTETFLLAGGCGQIYIAESLCHSNSVPSSAVDKFP